MDALFEILRVVGMCLAAAGVGVAIAWIGRRADNQRGDTVIGHALASGEISLLFEPKPAETERRRGSESAPRSHS